MRNRINWPLVLNALASDGVTQTELSRLIGMSQAAISRIACGVTADPAHSAGEALARLYRERIGQEPPQVAASDQKHPAPSAERSCVATDSIANLGATNA